jgi:hypothetical protein
VIDCRSSTSAVGCFHANLFRCCLLSCCVQGPFRSLLVPIGLGSDQLRLPGLPCRLSVWPDVEVGGNSMVSSIVHLNLGKNGIWKLALVLRRTGISSLRSTHPWIFWNIHRPNLCDDRSICSAQGLTLNKSVRLKLSVKCGDKVGKPFAMLRKG